MDAVEITRKDHQAVKDAVKLMNNAKDRREKGRFIVEGTRLCEEALIGAERLFEIYYTASCFEKNRSLCERISKKCEKIYKISADVANKIADTTSPQGLFVVGSSTQKTIKIDEILPTGQFILLENVQDPSNLGSIFRTAEALGLTGIFLSGDCCDPYNSKAMRAAMGAIFRVPFLVEEDMAEMLQKLKKKMMRPIAAVPDGEASKITSIRFFKGVIMCVGNEGAGLSDSLMSVCGEKVTIPMNGGADSLNAATAAAILMWEMVRNYYN